MPCRKDSNDSAANNNDIRFDIPAKSPKARAIRCRAVKPDGGGSGNRHGRKKYHSCHYSGFDTEGKSESSPECLGVIE